MSRKQKFLLAAWIILVIVGPAFIGPFIKPIWLMFAVAFLYGIVISPLLIAATRKPKVHYGIRF